MAGIEVDRSEWPLVMIRFPAAPVRDAALARYLAQLDRIGARGEPYVTISDLSAMRAPLTADQLWTFDRWMQRREATLSVWARGNAIVAPTPLTRAITRTVYWRWREPPSYRVFGEVEVARRWAQRRLGRRAAAGGGVPGRAAVAAAAPPPGPASIVDQFAEPALLVDADGEVVFANRAAERQLAEPARWLAAVMAASDGAPPLRIVRVGVGPRALRLVIVDQGAAFATLPPSLRRIAAGLARGESDKEIAARVGLSLATVRTYVQRLYERAGVHDRRALMRRWLGEG